jgi:hypothetical protein
MTLQMSRRSLGEATRVNDFDQICDIGTKSKVPHQDAQHRNAAAILKDKRAEATTVRELRSNSFRPGISCRAPLARDRCLDVADTWEILLPPVISKHWPTYGELKGIGWAQRRAGG